LFDKQQKFGFTDLDYFLETDMVQTLISKYEYTSYAQALWTDFVNDARKSTKAKITRATILA
jgi:ABC-type amino acid transport system permease subunit